MEEEKEILVPMCPNCCEGLKFIEMKPGVSWTWNLQLEVKKQNLRNAYIAANKDIGQIEALEEWKETLSDGVEMYILREEKTII